jgi:transketolase
VEQLLTVLRRARETEGRPSVVIAQTTPGHPISELSGRFDHYAKLSPEQAERAVAELGAERGVAEP